MATNTANPASIRSPVSATAYRQQARRLRHHYRNDPAALHLSLRALAARRDRTTDAEPVEAKAVSVNSVHRVRQVVVSNPAAESPAPTPRIDPLATILQASPEAVSEFATLVRVAVSQGLLSHTDRNTLFTEAAVLGISRFEANLIIAAVEHRGPHTPRQATTTLMPSRRRSVLPAVIAVVVVQSLIALAGWMFFHV